MKKIFPLVMILAGMLLLGLAGYAYWHVVHFANTLDVPSRLAGMDLTQKQVGTAALDSIHQLHTMDFPLVTGIVAGYGDNGTTLWLAETTSESSAIDQVGQMEANINAGGTPFTFEGIFQFSGRDVTMLSSAGQSHFFLRSGRAVIWVSIPPNLAEQAVQELLAYYP